MALKRYTDIQSQTAECRSSAQCKDKHKLPLQTQLKEMLFVSIRKQATCNSSMHKVERVVCTPIACDDRSTLHLQQHRSTCDCAQRETLHAQINTRFKQTSNRSTRPHCDIKQTSNRSNRFQCDIKQTSNRSTRP